MSDLEHIMRLVDAESGAVTAENPTGARGAGATSAPGDDAHCSDAARDLGRGWKVRPCLRAIEPAQSVTIADLEGPGVVTHIWMTVDPRRLRELSFRVFYDGQDHASIATPLGDFFANGVDGVADVRSIAVAVLPRGGMNCYWPMPFGKRIRVEVTNDGETPVNELFYQIDFERRALAPDAAYLHASWHRATTERAHPEHVILDVRGRGHYVGTYLVWNQLANGWWGEGEVKFAIDDDDDTRPSICGTGTEDYFGGAWSFARGEDDQRPRTYTSAYLGYPQACYEGMRVPVHAMYRWHLPDPIRFRTRLRATVQALGWWPNGTYQPLADDIASTAFWYQTLPSNPIASLPGMSARWPR